MGVVQPHGSSSCPCPPRGDLWVRICLSSEDGILGCCTAAAGPNAAPLGRNCSRCQGRVVPKTVAWAQSSLGAQVWGFCSQEVACCRSFLWGQANGTWHAFVCEHNRTKNLPDTFLLLTETPSSALDIGALLGPKARHSHFRLNQTLSVWVFLWLKTLVPREIPFQTPSPLVTEQRLPCAHGPVSPGGRKAGPATMVNRSCPG